MTTQKLGLNDKVNFGKYKGKLVSDVIKEDISYFKYRFTFLNKEAQKIVLEKHNS